MNYAEDWEFVVKLEHWLPINQPHFLQDNDLLHIPPKYETCHADVSDHRVEYK